MDFETISSLFVDLENSSQRLKKILILRDFLDQNKIEEVVFLFDLIVGNFQRKIDNRKVGISIKTLLDTFSFLFNKSTYEINQKFNSLGDIGKLVSELYKTFSQSSFTDSVLTLNQIKTFFNEIVKLKGNNSNKRKKEYIAKLFMLVKTEKEALFLARLLIGDLRIGVNEGVLKESFVNYFFNPINKVQKLCSKCGYINLNNKICYKCNNELKGSNSKDLLFISEEEINRLYFDDRRAYEILEKLIRKKKRLFIDLKEPRKLYNFLLSLVEKKYNLLNSFELFYEEVFLDHRNILNFNIRIGVPIKSMLGIKVDSVEEAFISVGKPALIDFKYDGLRMQIHNHKGEVNLFTRNLDNITEKFPEVQKYIKRFFSDVSFIVDSECVGYDYLKNEFLPFQSLSKRILSKDFAEVKNIHITLRFFDILYFQEKNLVDLPYRERRTILEAIFLNREFIQKFSPTIIKKLTEKFN